MMKRSHGDKTRVFGARLKNKTLRECIPLVFAIVFTPFIPAGAAAGVIPTLYQSFAGNLDWTGTGASLRTSSSNQCAVTTANTSTLSGIPSGATVRAAYLYWVGSFNMGQGVSPD